MPLSEINVAEKCSYLFSLIRHWFRFGDKLTGELFVVSTDMEHCPEVDSETHFVMPESKNTQRTRGSRQFRRSPQVNKTGAECELRCLLQ